jgi:hypothetical protein
MKWVKEVRFVKLLNEQLNKDPEGEGMKPFVLGRNGYEWVSETLFQESIYQRALRSVRDRYGISH